MHPVFSSPGFGMQIVSPYAGAYYDPGKKGSVHTPLGITSFAHGGTMRFDRPSLISVAEAGPEYITGEPVGAGSRRGGGNIIIQLSSGTVVDDLSAARWAGRRRHRPEAAQ